MRPVDKGESPYTSIEDYSEALPYLEEAIGMYCSYCELPISHVPEIEHVCAKSKGGSLTDWDNLLLGCKYCNTRKGIKVTPDNVGDFLWPDKDNTALAYTYLGGSPKINQAVLEQIDPTGRRLSQAQNLFKLVGLDHVPDLGEKDRRHHNRNRAYEWAMEALKDWKKIKYDTPNNTPEQMEPLKRQIIRNAQGQGFFSVWMTVFAEEPDVLDALIEGFSGTNRFFFDERNHPKLI